MNTAPQPTTYIELILGLTPWVPLVSAHPPYIGWWRTRVASNPNKMQPQRRWWDGEHFSTPILPGATEEAEADAKDMRALVDDLEWCGLRRPHLAGYTHTLVKSPRLDMLQRERYLRELGHAL
jgi:hypothetical protein